VVLEASPQIADFMSLPAPSAGIDAVTNLMEMKPTEALYAYNVIMTQNGPTVRPGNQQWVTNLTGTGGVRTIIPVRGAGTAGAQDFLLACTANGIWNCTSSTAAPTKVVTFATTTGNAGYCEWDSFTNLNGDVCIIVCDDVNGAFVLDTATDTWNQITEAFQGTGEATGTTALTIQSTVSGVIQVGGEVNTLNLATGVLTDTGVSIVSGSGTAWVMSGTLTLASGSAIVIINNSAQIYGVNPSQFVAVRIYNNTPFFVQGGTGNAWYLPPGQLYGQATAFNYGNRFTHGGNLNNLYIFTYGSAFGTFVYLIAISDGGDVVAYTGISPTSASTFTLSGVWYVGDLPSGRRSASNYGGDLNILCAYGVLQISSLFFQKNPDDPTLYLTRKIAPAISRDIQTFTGQFGFSFVAWPAQQSLIITEPVVMGTVPRQYCYNLATNAWSVFKTLDFQCGAYWHGNLFVGTSTGTVLVYSGNSDNVLLNGTGGIAINFGVLGAFQQGPKVGYKFVDLIRPYFSTSSPVSYQVLCQFDFDLTDLALGSVSFISQPISGGWDSGIWDSAVWGAGTEGSDNQFSVQGGTDGMGQFVAVGLLGATMGQTTLIGYQLSVRQTKGFL
jgi:hypothetical protein